MKFLLSTNSPDRKRTENIVDEINTALYNRDNGYGKSDFDVQIMIGAHLKWKIKFKIYFTVYVREWKSDFYLLVSHGLSLYIVYDPMMTYNNKV